MDPKDKMINEDDLEVSIDEYENFFFEPSDEEQDLDLEVALAINSLINDYND